MAMVEAGHELARAVLIYAIIVDAWGKGEQDKPEEVIRAYDDMIAKARALLVDEQPIDIPPNQG